VTRRPQVTEIRFRDLARHVVARSKSNCANKTQDKRDQANQEEAAAHNANRIRRAQVPKTSTPGCKACVVLPDGTRDLLEVQAKAKANENSDAADNKICDRACVIRGHLIRYHRHVRISSISSLFANLGVTFVAVLARGIQLPDSSKTSPSVT